jgi:TatD DNase family protein
LFEESAAGVHVINVIDTHAHLNEIENIVDALQRSAQAGVNKVVAVGMDLNSNRDTLTLANEFPGVVLPAIGYHPWSFHHQCH